MNEPMAHWQTALAFALLAAAFFGCLTLAGY